MTQKDNTLEVQNTYYRNQYLESFRSNVEGDHTMTFIVKEDTDLLVYAKAAKTVWESIGDYPSDFIGVIRMERGNAFATFKYQGALNLISA